MSRQKEYYVFARPTSMLSEHIFTDDVAICKAISKSQAIKKFSRYYADVKDDEVIKLLSANHIEGGVVILTDY